MSNRRKHSSAIAVIAIALQALVNKAKLLSGNESKETS
jgi:hypothetical protein